jgi:hypothetical protein
VEGTVGNADAATGAPAAAPLAVLGAAVLGTAVLGAGAVGPAALGLGPGRADARADAGGVGTAGRGEIALGTAILGAALVGAGAGRAGARADAAVVGVVVVDAAGKAGEKPDAAPGNAGEGGNVCARGPVGPTTHNQKPTDRSPTTPATTDLLQRDRPMGLNIKDSCGARQEERRSGIVRRRISVSCRFSKRD